MNKIEIIRNQEAKFLSNDFTLNFKFKMEVGGLITLAWETFKRCVSDILLRAWGKGLVRWPLRSFAILGGMAMGFGFWLWD